VAGRFGSLSGASRKDDLIGDGGEEELSIAGRKDDLPGAVWEEVLIGDGVEHEPFRGV
jgi:hypothetical protein